MIKAPRQIIDEIGVARLSELTSQAPNAVRQWKWKNRIPRANWAYIVAARIPGASLADLEASEAVAGRDSATGQAA